MKYTIAGIIAVHYTFYSLASKKSSFTVGDFTLKVVDTQENYGDDDETYVVLEVMKKGEESATFWRIDGYTSSSSEEVELDYSSIKAVTGKTKTVYVWE